MADGITPLGQAYRAYEQLEGQLSVALDRLVATNGFADLLATSATNVMALTRRVNGTMDLMVRSTRLAARRDVTDLARQLARTEDKLERLLQAVEGLQAQLDQAEASSRAPRSPSATEPVPPADEAGGGGHNGVATRARGSSPRRKEPT